MSSRRLLASLVFVLTLPAGRAGAQCNCLEPSFPAPMLLSPASFVGAGAVDAGYADLDGDGRKDVVVLDRLGRVLVFLGRGAGFFSEPQAFSAFPSASALSSGVLTVADLDGDGRADVAVAWRESVTFSQTDSQLSILFGDGSGLLSAPQVEPVQSNHAFSALRATDVDGDGRLDLVYVDYANGTAAFSLVTVHNGGAGQFGPYHVDALPGFAGGPLWSDFNGDGRADIAFGRSSPSRITVLLNTGATGFGPPIDTARAFDTTLLAAGDVNGDGKVDLVDPLRTYPGAGNGTFGTGVVNGLAASGSRVVLADLDNDGSLDAVGSDSGILATSRGQGNGTFSPREVFYQQTTNANPSSLIPVVADFDDDGANDILAVDRSATDRILYRNDRTGHFATLAPGAPTDDHHVEIGDFNGDGVPDVLVLRPNPPSGISVSLGLGGGTFAPPVATAVADIGSVSPVVPYGIADFNGDHFADVALAGGSGANSRVQILLGHGDGTFTFAAPIAVGTNPTGTLAGDFNGDGKADLVVNAQGLAFYAGLGNGSFTAGPVSSGVTAGVAGDFDKDGHLDVADFAGAGLAVYFGNGTGGFALRDAIITGPGHTIFDRLIATDFTGDGNVDLVATAEFSAAIQVASGSPSGALGAPYTLTAFGTNATRLTAGDFNGDGRSDVAVLDGRGSLALYTDPAGPPGYGWQVPGGSSLASADFDGDGRADLVTAPGPLVLLSTRCKARRMGMVQNLPALNLQGTIFATQPVVSLRDDGNNLVCESGGATATLLSGSPGPATLVGTTTVALTAGQASYSDLRVSAPGPLFRLEFTHGAARPTRSRFFRVQQGTISIGDVTIVEGASGTRSALFPVSLSASPTQTVTVDYHTVDGTATSPSDYLASSGTLTFAPGQTLGAIVVPVNGDIVDEVDETFLVRLDNPSPEYAIGDGEGQATIVDDDPNSDLSVAKSDGAETATPGQTLVYTITIGNAGPNDAVAATVSDVLPSGLTSAAWTCAATGGASCGAASGTGSILEVVSLPVGASIVYSLTAQVASAPTTVRNTATVAAPAGSFDPDLANNSATDDDLLVCDAYTSLVPDGRTLMGSRGPGASAWYLVFLHSDSSYSIEATNVLGTEGAPTVTVVRGDDGCSGTPAVVRDTTGLAPATGASSRGSFTASGADGRYRIRVENPTGVSLDFSLRMGETSLFSTAWSTNGTYNAYYSFQNTSDASVTGVLELRDAVGVVVGGLNVSVPAGRTLGTNTLALGVPRNRTGTARFTHDGPPGAVLAQAAIANFGSTPPYVQPVTFRSLREEE